MTASKYRVELTEAEREYLNGLVRRGKSPARPPDQTCACAAENRRGSVGPVDS